MAASFDNIFGIHETALRYRSARAGVLAANIANAETPGYRARDLRFEDVLAEASGNKAVPGMRATHPMHFTAAAVTPFAHLEQFREPLQGALDQNTVDSAAEYARFAENAMRYQASLRFLNGRISGLIKAFKGE